MEVDRFPAISLDDKSCQFYGISNKRIHSMEKLADAFAEVTSKITFQKTCVLLVALCLAFIQGCGPTSDTSNQDAFGDEVRLSRIENSQGGVIGDYNFYQSYPRFMDDAVKAVGTISLYNTDGADGPKFIGNGVGIHLYEKDVDYEYILTAAHIIYDVETGKKKGNAIRFGQIGDGQKIISQKISRVPNEHNNVLDRDFILIPINRTEGRIPLNVKLRSNNFSPNKSIVEKYNGYFISISSTNGEKATQPVRFVQKANNLYLGERGDTKGYVYTDLDAIKGLSGSPVFFVSNQNLQLIGVISTKSRVENCNEITSNRYCGNGVALLPAKYKKPTHKGK